MTLDISPTLGWAMGVILGVLVTASLILRVLRFAKPEVRLDEVRARVRSWWVMAGVFSIALVLRWEVSLLLFALVSVLALREYIRLASPPRSHRVALFWVYLAIPIQYYWIATGWYGMFIIFIPVYVFLFLPFRLMLAGDTDGFLTSVGAMFWGLMITVFSISHVAYLLVLPAEANSGMEGAGLVLYLVCLTQSNDVAQFLWGKALGRHAVVPAISPKKTWEGLLGGALTTLVLAVVLAPWLTPLTLPESVAAGLILGFGGFAGDVVISAIKRDKHVKDTGSLLPGHGGILDRIDSLTYTAPLFFHFVRYLHT